jgi:hypothetical protein
MSDMRRYVPIVIAGGARIAAACCDTVSRPAEATSFSRRSDRSLSILAIADAASLSGRSSSSSAHSPKTRTTRPAPAETSTNRIET